MTHESAAIALFLFVVMVGIDTTASTVEGSAGALGPFQWLAVLASPNERAKQLGLRAIESRHHTDNANTQ